MHLWQDSRKLEWWMHLEREVSFGYSRFKVAHYRKLIPLLAKPGLGL